MKGHQEAHSGQREQLTTRPEGEKQLGLLRKLQAMLCDFSVLERQTLVCIKDSDLWWESFGTGNQEPYCSILEFCELTDIKVNSLNSVMEFAHACALGHSSRV